MQIKILAKILLILVFSACGNMTEVDDRKLESFSNITNAGTVNVDKSGVLRRKTNGSGKDMIVYGGTQYSVSIYSSYSSLEFIAARPLGFEGNVQFKGEIRGVEVVLEAIKAN
jgi:hypothetical protein